MGEVEFVNLSRRNFVRGTAVSLAALAAGASTYGCAATAEADVDVFDTGCIRPPGAGEPADFDARCIRCGKCIQACPYESIHAVRNVFSLNSSTPYLDVRAKACRMCEDLPCIAVCPTEALHHLDDRRDIRMGTAVIDEESCIAFDGMRCEVCYRACPLIDEAITIDFRERPHDAQHMVFAPVIHEDACTGCGLCVERCVTDVPAVHVVTDMDEYRKRIDAASN